MNQCDGCERDVYGSGLCPDCYAEADTPSHGTHYQRKQARSQKADEDRHRIVDNVVNQK